MFSDSMSDDRETEIIQTSTEDEKYELLYIISFNLTSSL